MDSGDRGKWALLVGINRYRCLGAEAQLEGCVNDVQILRDALIRRFGFAEDRMTVLLDEQATRAAILDGMEDLVRKVGEDDIVVFHFSGHGSQQTDGPEADEPDGWDETLVPYDSGRAPWKNRDIADDEIYDWLQRLTAKTRYVTLIIDACHSGTVVRHAFGGKLRQISPDCRPYDELAVSEKTAGEHEAPGQSTETEGPVFRGPGQTPEKRDGVDAGPSGWFPQGRNYVLIAACANHECASEVVVGDSAGIVHGALSYSVVQELMNGDFTGGTYRELLERLTLRVKARSLAQTPQVEGDRDRKIFGVEEVVPMRFVYVLDRNGDTVTLDAGSACGLAKGSEWIVFPQETRSLDDDVSPIGKVLITAVHVTSSEATILEEPKALAIQAGARSVETVRCLKESRLKVEIVAAEEDRPAVQSLIQDIWASKFLEEALPGETPDARVYFLEQGLTRSNVADPAVAAAMRDLRGRGLAAVLADGTQLIGPALHRDQSQALEILRDNLENAARLRGIASLRNDGSPLAGQVDLVLHRLEAGQCVPPQLEGDEPVFVEGDHVALEIRNDSDRPLYFYVIDIGLTRRVGLVYPPEGAYEYVESHSTFHVGVGERKLPPLFIPKDFELMQSRGKNGELAGRETLKLFVSTSPANFQILYNSGYRFRTGVAKSLDEFLEATFGGGGQGAYRSAGEDWTTVERSFLLRSRRADEAAA